MKRIFPIVGFAMANLVGPLSMACFAPKPEQTVAWQDLVSRTKTIVIAENIGSMAIANAGSSDFPEVTTNFDMKVLEVLKSENSSDKKTDKTTETVSYEVQQKFQIAGSMTNSEVNTSFHQHKDKDFWHRSNKGRVQIMPDCSLVPQFVKGKKYLIFVDQPYHFKSFELVNSKNDQWLMKVRQQINKKTGKI